MIGMGLFYWRTPAVTDMLRELGLLFSTRVKNLNLQGRAAKKQDNFY